MKFRNLVLAAALTASLSAARKKPVPEEWQTGTLVRIAPYASGGGIIPEIGAGGRYGPISQGETILVIRGSDTQGESGFWLAVLGPRDREPNVHAGSEVKYAVEVVPCRFGSCGDETTKPDQFGRTH